MAYDFYSKTNKLAIDGFIIGMSFWLAYQIRFEGAVPPERISQMWVLLPAMIAGRLATNAVLEGMGGCSTC